MNVAAIFSPARLWAIVVKEFIQMRRDRVTFAMMLGVPLILLVLFGYAINNDPKRLPAALVTASPERSRFFVGHFGPVTDPANLMFLNHACPPWESISIVV